MRGKHLCLILLGMMISSHSWAFEEMVRHGYLSCTACHFSPNGGGIVRSFGRATSKDVLSSWASDGEEEFLYGAIHSPEWLSFGGDVRALQSHRETSTSVSARFLMMQMDFETAVQWKDFSFVGSIGAAYWSATTAPTLSWGDAISRRHFIMYHPFAEPRLVLRAGKFAVPYGLNISDHILFVRRGLGLDQGTESYNLEASWSDQSFDVFLSLNVGRWENSALGREQGAVLRGRYYLGPRMRLGLSYLYGNQNRRDRHLFGPSLSWGLSEKIFILSEVNVQTERPVGGTPVWGAAGFGRIGYEVLKGFNLLATIEYSKLDFSTSLSRTSLWLGLQFFPRPHWELVLTWQKTKDLSGPPEWDDFVWLMAHFYL